MKEQHPSENDFTIEIYFVTKMYVNPLCLYTLTSICEEYNPCKRILHLTIQLTYIMDDKQK